MFFINNEMWDIVFVEPMDAILLKPDGYLAPAVCDDYYRTIFISNDVSGDFLKKILCHEITHAAMYAYDVLLDSEQEELIAELVATFGEEIVDITNDIFYYLKRKQETKGRV